MGRLSVIIGLVQLQLKLDFQLELSLASYYHISALISAHECS